MEPVNVRWYVEDVSAHSAPTAVAGLPGVGHVGELVVDHLIRALSAVKVAEITSTLFRPQMYLGKDAVLRLPRNEIYFVPGTDTHTPVIFLAGDCQSTSAEGHYTLAEGYLRVFDLLGVRCIYTLGGYGVGHMVEHPRVLSALSSSSLKEEVLTAGAVISPDGRYYIGVAHDPGGRADPLDWVISPDGRYYIGVAGLLVTLGRLHGMECIALLGETSGYLVDPGVQRRC